MVVVVVVVIVVYHLREETAGPLAWVSAPVAAATWFPATTKKLLAAEELKLAPLIEPPAAPSTAAASRLEDKIVPMAVVRRKGLPGEQLHWMADSEDEMVSGAEVGPS